MIRKTATAILLAALFAVPTAQAANPGSLAIEPSNPAFEQGLQTSFQLPKVAHKTDDGGTFPGQTPASVGLDLLLAPALPDSLLSVQLKSSKPLSTNKLLDQINVATAASTSLKDLRANVLRIASAYMAAPTLEDKGSPNRSKLICALGTSESCSQRWPWCAIFASSMWRMAGIRAMSLTPPVSGLVAWGKLHHRWHEAVSKVTVNGKATTARFTPAAGDLVAYGCNRTRDWCQHTGIVVSSDAKYLRTIEGNTSSPVPGRDGVASKLRALDSWISGYVTLS